VRVALHTGQLDQPVPGGIGRYVQGLLLHLPQGGVGVVPFSGGRWHYEAWHRFRRPAVRLPGAPADVIHAPSLAVPPPGRRPLVVTVHDLAFRTHPDCFPPRGRAFHERGLALAREEAAAVVVPSRFTAGELEAAGFEAARIHVVPHGIDLPPEHTLAKVWADPPTRPGTRRAARGVPPGPYVLFVGTLEPRKGIDVLVAAHAALRASRPDLALVVAGPRGWGPGIDLDRPGVVATGRVDEAELDALYRGAGALALPSRSEGFGLPALEAMARGCPVVASAAGSLPEVVGDAGLLVPPGAPEALADALGTILDDCTEHARLAALGRSRVAAFTWAACVEGHRTAYRAATAK
jgi:glycosyltransferase involved in cell wall biosynthesis